jgi:hypothetical protein
MAAHKSSSTAIVGVGGPLREQAIAAAERTGLPVGEWVERAVRKALRDAVLRYNAEGKAFLIRSRTPTLIIALCTRRCNCPSLSSHNKVPSRCRQAVLPSIQDVSAGPRSAGIYRRKRAGSMPCLGCLPRD